MGRALVLAVVWFITIAPALATDLIANVSARKVMDLDGEWKIVVDPYAIGTQFKFFEDHKPQTPSELVEYDFDRAPALHVPGDWNSQSTDLLYYEGSVWYRRKFECHVSQEKRTYLYFGAANYRATVYLNGEKLGEHRGGFTAFNFEVTGKLRDGENLLVVEVNDVRHPEDVPTMKTDWWNYGGLTRGVTLVELPKAFIQNYFVQLAKGSTTEVAGWVQLNGVSAPTAVSLSIPEAHIQKTITTDAQGRAEFRMPAKLTLWSPENPKLYDVIVSASSDTVKDRIGFRSIETRGTTLLLNGKPIFLRGISIHEEAPFRSARAFSAADDETLLGWAKELGCNFVRLAHYPHHESMVRRAEEMGMLVWSEIPVYWDIDWNNPDTLAVARQQLREEIERDQNRAAIVLWSLANETPAEPRRLEFLRTLAADARTMDATRLLTAAMNRNSHQGDVRSIDDPLGEIVDVLAVNEYIGWYEGRAEDADHTEWKIGWQKPLIFSEFGADAQYGLHGSPDQRWTEEFQANVYRHQLDMLRRIPFLSGLSPWVLMDFRSPRRLLPGIQDLHNRKGLVSDQGQRKQSFYLLQDYYRERANKPAN